MIDREMGKKEVGFTLIESMVAMLIVSIGLLAMANLLITAIRVNQASEMRLEASSTARAVMTASILQVRSTVGLTQATMQANAAGLVDSSKYDTTGTWLTLTPDPTVRLRLFRCVGDVDLDASWRVEVGGCAFRRDDQCGGLLR
ncbi:MAG: prepilin-type N-terminal cleavage/methylation domain-containing protein [Ghiorsea sp.]|nr:prepilin-type N-terminal cleavage/methylation domain-containing protein [Ghiorsea sp.]